MENVEQKLLAAAEKIFVEKGFSAAKTTDIAAQAGVTHAMLHYYFRTKEALFDKVFDEKIKFFASELSSVFMDTEEKDILKRICKAAGRHFDVMAQNPQLPGFIFTELRAHPDKMGKAVEGIKSAAGIFLPILQKDIDEGVKNGTVCQVEAATVMLDIMALNSVSIMLTPIASNALGVDRQKYLAARRKENIETIRKRLSR